MSDLIERLRQKVKQGKVESKQDVESTSADPFKHFESGVSDEQLETWHQMNEKVKGLVEMSEDEEMEEEDIYFDTALLVGSATTPGVSLPGPSSSPQKAAPSPQKTTGFPDQGAIHIQLPNSNVTVAMDITLQYLAGKISFLEFSEQMEQGPSGETAVSDVMNVDSELTTNEDSYSNLEIMPDVTLTTEEEKTAEKRSPKKGREGRKKPRRRMVDLPRRLEQAMGEVNMTFARGDHEEAIKQCMEIIRQAPQATKPFQTLGMLYEDMGDMEKSLQYYLIAAYLDPRDAEEWVRLAELSIELDDINQAIICYSKAIKAADKKYEYIWERSRLYEQQKEYKKALEGYQSVLPLLPADNTEQYFKLALSVTRSFFEMGEKTQALETLRKAFESHPEQITADDVNLLLELQMPEKMFLESIEILVKHCGLVLVFPGGRVWSSDKPLPIADIEGGHWIPISCTVPDMLPIDLRVKLAVCMIHQKYLKVVKTVTEPLFAENIEDNGDLYLDVAEAYMDNGYYHQAKHILSLLVKTENYNLAAVWLRYGECQKYLGELSGAVMAYTKVVALAPSHIGARMSLSALQQQLGKHVEALEALEHGDQEETRLTKEEQQLLLHKCHLLKGQGKIDEYLENSKRLLFQEWKEMNEYDMSLLHGMKTYKHRKENLVSHLERKGKDVSRFDSQKKLKQKGKTREDWISLDDLWDIFHDLCSTLIKAKRYTDFEETTLLGLLCPRFQEDPKTVKEVEFLCLLGALFARNGSSGYCFARSFVLENIDSIPAWNIFMQIVMVCNDMRQNRFVLRRMLHYPDNLPLCIINGHNSMVSASYKHSLGEYASAFHRCPADPMISLCIGLNFIHISSQRFSAKRHYLITQGLMFFNNYMELRGPCQESYYNMARALHQINILYGAVYYYRKVLETEPAVDERNGMFDLRKEAAYNLSLIYQHSGSSEYARYLLYRYCVI